jgi:hypothetical protein
MFLINIKMKLLNFSIFYIVYFLITCNTNIQDVKPKNLDEAISYFEKTWSRGEKDKFKSLPEDEAVNELHFETGLWIRNNWIRGKRDTDLVNFFINLGIFSPDDMSGIILTSLHRKLNGKDLGLEGQIKSCKDYWTPIIECEKREKQEAVNNYKKYEIGNTIRIFFPVITSDNASVAVQNVCPYSDWNYDPNNDLLIEGIIKEKYFVNDSSNVFFKVLIKEINCSKALIFSEKEKVGNVVDYQLKGLKIN